jgi:large subunit ribosomal protein L7/L12
LVNNIKMTDEKKEVVVPEKFQKLVAEIEKMSVLDLSELVKVLEEKFGVSAAAPMMMGPAMAGAAVGEAGAAVEEKTEFDVEVTGAGASKINVIKVVREVTGLGLKDAKDLVDAAPKVVKEKAPKAEAEEMKKKLEAAGATVTLK